MDFLRKNGAASNVFRVKLRNSSTGAGLPALTEASAGLIIATICDNEATTTRYRAGSGEIETIAALGTFAAPTAGKCRFKEVDATNHPGLYEVQLADARFAVASAKILRVTISGAASLLEKEVAIQLSAIDVDNSARMGMTALPNAAAGAANGLPTLVSGAPGDGLSLGQVAVTAPSSMAGIAEAVRDVDNSTSVPGTLGGDIPTLAEIVAAILGITKEEVAELDTSLFLRWARDQLAKIGIAGSYFTSQPTPNAAGFIYYGADYHEDNLGPIILQVDGKPDMTDLPLFLGFGVDAAGLNPIVVVEGGEVLDGSAGSQRIQFQPRREDTLLLRDYVGNLVTAVARCDFDLSGGGGEKLYTPVATADYEVRNMFSSP